MFDEERLDPHGVGNLPRVLTIKNKSSTFGVRGRVECALIADVLTNSSLFLVKFQTKEGARNESTLMNQDVLVICDCKRATKQHVYQHHQRPDCQGKITWNQVRVLTRPNLSRFFLAKLYQQRISRLHVVMKMIYNFPKKSELPKFIVPVKISWLIFSAVEKFAEIRAGSLSRPRGLRARL